MDSPYRFETLPGWVCTRWSQDFPGWTQAPLRLTQFNWTSLRLRSLLHVLEVQHWVLADDQIGIFHVFCDNMCALTLRRFCPELHGPDAPSSVSEHVEFGSLPPLRSCAHPDFLFLVLEVAHSESLMSLQSFCTC